MTDKEIVERAKEAEKRTGFVELVHSPISKGVNSAFGIGFIEGMVEYRNSLQEEPQVKESAEIQHVNDMCKENGNSFTKEPVSEVWHDAQTDQPQAKKKILATNEYGACEVDFAINMALYWPKVIKWAYIEDLLNL